MQNVINSKKELAEQYGASPELIEKIYKMMIDFFKWKNERMEKNKLKSPTIYIQAAIALLIIQLVQKIVREIPGAFKIMTMIMSIRKKFRNIEEEISLAGLNAGDYILDFGCGLGLNTIPAAQKVKKQGKVFALDISPQAIEIVKDKARKNELENIETILSDCNTKLEDKRIDIVYLHNTLPIVRDKENVLSEIDRVLKIGGRLSYMSRAISRSYGEDTIDAEKLKKLLVSNNKFKLSKEKNGHLVFEKIG